jgi:2'-5' RNA ligase
MRAVFRFVLLASLVGFLSIGAGAAENQPVRQGSLFSAILCADTSLGAAWARLLPEAHARFRHLKLTRVEDLHITVIYIGASWSAETLARLRPFALTGLSEQTTFTPEVVTLGATGDVVAVELHTPSTKWHTVVTAAKAELNRLGLKSPDRYDSNFRPHVTLAQTIRRPSDPADIAELRAFNEWMQAVLVRDSKSFTLILGPTTPVHLLLAEAPRPSDAPDYVLLKE